MCLHVSADIWNFSKPADFGPANSRKHPSVVPIQISPNESYTNNALSDDRKRVLIGAISTTADGGLTWQDVRLERSVGRFDKIIFSGKLGILSGDAGLNVSTDGGTEWKNALSDYSRKDTGERPEVKGIFVLDERR